MLRRVIPVNFGDNCSNYDCKFREDYNHCNLDKRWCISWEKVPYLCKTLSIRQFFTKLRETNFEKFDELFKQVLFYGYKLKDDDVYSYEDRLYIFNKCEKCPEYHKKFWFKRCKEYGKLNFDKCSKYMTFEDFELECRKIDITSKEFEEKYGKISDSKLD